MSPAVPAAATSPSAPTTRDRLIDSAVALLQEKGPSASGTMEILKAARAPRGSLYHHFPEGKEQLVVEAVQRAGSATHASIAAALHDDNVALPVRVEALLHAIGVDQVANDFRRGCAVGATTLETSCTPGPVQDATRDAFATWTALLIDVLRNAGVSTPDAEALADTIVAIMEGATMLARARHDITPIEHTATMARRLIASVLDRQNLTGQG